MDIRNTPPAAAIMPRARSTALKAAADFQTELFRVLAGWLPAVPRWELRRDISGLIFRDARRAQELRQRCRELKGSIAALHLSRGVPGVELIEALCAAPDANAAFRVIYAVVKPALNAHLTKLLRDDLNVFDAPSQPAVEANIDEITRQLSWARTQPEIDAEAPGPWFDRIKSLSASLGDALKEDPSPAQPLRHGRKIGRLPILHSVIPTGFRESCAMRDPDHDRDYRKREVFTAHNFLMEIQAADSCASLLFDAPDMPWDFYFDAARHMWDETRHCEFGELKLKSIGLDIREIGLANTAYVLRQTLDPLDRYAALTTQEADAFPGKHAGLKDALAHGDELQARAWSYDIADETQHVRYGRQWIPVMIKETDEPRSYAMIKRDAENWRRDVLAVAYTTAGQAPYLQSRS